MDVTVGIAIAGPVVSPDRVGLGRPIWGTSALLRDLELRLGLTPLDDTNVQRLPLWTARIRAVGDLSAFYRRSFETDELGTAARLLEWRDLLVESGWNGQTIGDERVDALAALEQHPSAPIPPGRSDRIARIENELGRDRIYERLSLLDPLELWPGRWRRIFDRLAQLGTRVEQRTVEDGFLHLRDRSRDSDLAVLQARLLGGELHRPIRGDGSLLVLRGDTPSDLAELTAALLATTRDSQNVVIRLRDIPSLDYALERHGLPSQGWLGRTTWRPAMQLLALALELAFEPRDPNRVLELLTLPVGPFRGLLGARLARAVTRQPGIGGKEWARQKTEAAIRLRAQAAGDPKAANAVEMKLERVAIWLERPGAIDRIRRGELQAVVERVQGWLYGRLAGDEAAVHLPAYIQTAAFADVLRQDPRASLTREDVRQLFDTFARTEQEHELSIEQAGRVAHVSHPAALLGPCDHLFLWGFVSGTEKLPRRLPWTDDEQHLLAKNGIHIPQPTATLRADAASWRRAALAARERIVFIVPSTIAGVANPIHPFWDEIHARLKLDERTAGLLTRSPRDVLDEDPHLVPTSSIISLPLPECRSAWNIAPHLLLARDERTTTSVSALERITSCPLAWVLEHRAAVVSGAMSRVAHGGLLNGNLAHRLVESLHLAHAFDLGEDDFLATTDARLEALLQTEGATLLLPGASVERLQLTRQLRRAARELYRYLRDSDFRIAAVEEELSTSSAIGPLHGRIDLRLVGPDGQIAILDLKWGGNRYAELLEKGRSVQLAVYARALGHDPPAGYFAIARGAVLSTDPRMRAPVIEGPSLAETWRRVEATASAVLESHTKGTVHVPAGRTPLPLLEKLRIPPGERDRYYEVPPDAPCEYCDYDGLCGRKWLGSA